MNIPTIVVIICLVMSFLTAVFPWNAPVPGSTVWALWAIAVILLCGVHL